MSSNSVTYSEKKSRLYNPISFIPLALVFSFFMPGILFALNAGRIYGPRSRNYLLALFAAIGAVLFAALFVFFDRVGNPARVGILGLNLATGGLLYTIQRQKYLESRPGNARARSLLWPILIAVTVVAVLGTLVIISDIGELRRPDTGRYDDHNNEITYDASITLDEVEKIAGQLRQAEVFQDDSGYAFRLKNDEKGYVLLIPLIDDATMTPEVEEFMKQLANYINLNGGLRKSLSVEPDNGQE